MSLRRGGIHPTTPSPNGSEDLRSSTRRLLLVEDDAELRRVVRLTLERPDLHILEVGDGDEAVEVACRTRPHVVILDWMLPGRSGIEVAEELRSRAATAHTRIIMLTARDGSEDIARGRAAGVFAFMTKPFSPLELVATLESAL